MKTFGQDYNYYSECDFEKYKKNWKFRKNFFKNFFSDNPFEGFTFQQSNPLSYSLRDHRNANLDNFTDFHWWKNQLRPKNTFSTDFPNPFDQTKKISHCLEQKTQFNFQSNLHGNLNIIFFVRWYVSWIFDQFFLSKNFQSPSFIKKLGSYQE